jgi:type 1 glutamine amidotransferase
MFGASAFADNVPYRELTSEEKAQLEAVAPRKAPTKPRAKRKVLIVHITKLNGKPVGGHPSIPHANYVITFMGRQTGAYEAVVNNDENVFRRENLKQYDAIVFNSTVGVLFEDPELRESLLDFVRSGKGLVGFHSAGATFVQYPKFDQFPEFGVMLGGYEDGGHPWRHTETTPIKIDDPANPINAGFKGQPFEINNEMFQFREPSLRDRLHVLLSIDMSRTSADPKRRVLKQRQQDLDFPVSWIKTYGKGRVFYTVLGHWPNSFLSTALLEHYLAGIQFALGDLKADATPSAMVKR